MPANLPHEVEIGVLKDVPILEEVPVVLPDPFLQLLAEDFAFPLRRWPYPDHSEPDQRQPGGRSGRRCARLQRTGDGGLLYDGTQR